jgi:putative transposase
MLNVVHALGLVVIGTEGVVRLAGPGRHGNLLGMTSSPNPYRGFRFPAEIIEHAVWLYHCFSLSLRDVELILAARGVVVSYESIREWGLRFGRLFANALKRRRPRPGDKWHMDEVLILSANSTLAVCSWM